MIKLFLHILLLLLICWGINAEYINENSTYRNASRIATTPRSSSKFGTTLRIAAGKVTTTERAAKEITTTERAAKKVTTHSSAKKVTTHSSAKKVTTSRPLIPITTTERRTPTKPRITTAHHWDDSSEYRTTRRRKTTFTTKTTIRTTTTPKPFLKRTEPLLLGSSSGKVITGTLGVATMGFYVAYKDPSLSSNEAMVFDDGHEEIILKRNISLSYKDVVRCQVDFCPRSSEVLCLENGTVFCTIPMEYTRECLIGKVKMACYFPSTCEVGYCQEHQKIYYEAIPCPMSIKFFDGIYNTTKCVMVVAYRRGLNNKEFIKAVDEDKTTMGNVRQFFGSIIQHLFQ